MNIKLSDINIDKNKLLRKIDNLHYQEALDILKNVVDEDIALNILFTEFNLFDPIKQLNTTYQNEYRNKFDTLYKALSRINMFIDILETPDYFIPIIGKYFPFTIDLIFDKDCKGGIYCTGFEFFSRLYESYINNDYTRLSNALIDSKLVDRDVLNNSFGYYLDSMYFEDKYDDMECCISFLYHYYFHYYQQYQDQSTRFGLLLSEINCFREEMSTINSRECLFRL